MAVFEVDGVRYNSGILDARLQSHVLRRIAPALLAMVEAWPAVVAARGEDNRINLDDATAVLGPFVASLNAMSDQDMDYVLNACLAVTDRQEAAGWAPVWGKSSQKPTAPLTMMTEWVVMYHVLAESLSKEMNKFGIDMTALLPSK